MSWCSECVKLGVMRTDTGSVALQFGVLARRTSSEYFTFSVPAKIFPLGRATVHSEYSAFFRTICRILRTWPFVHHPAQRIHSGFSYLFIFVQLTIGAEQVVQ